ncbi:hypothetical protein AAE478_000407 [Parahypoxylon ruwenzoriense]
MCGINYKVYWCIIGRHQAGEKIPGRQYICSAANALGFGGCGTIVDARPSTFLIKCPECLQKKEEERKKSKDPERPKDPEVKG